MPTPAAKGDLIVVSAPSGAGKTTLVKRLLRRVGELEFSVSYTTRPPRRGERDGVDYHFITPGRFRRMIRDREFLEWAEVYGHNYGTRKLDLKRILRQGKDVLQDLDTQVHERSASCLFRSLPPRGTHVGQLPRERVDSHGIDIAQLAPGHKGCEGPHIRAESVIHPHGKVKPRGGRRVQYPPHTLRTHRQRFFDQDVFAALQGLDRQ